LEQTANRLKLKQVGLETLSFSTISGTQEEKDYKIVDVPICKDHEKLIINAVCINHLPERVYTPGLKEVVNKLSQEINLAKCDVDNDGTTKYELLIGADYYYDIVDHAQAVIKKGSLYLVPTYFGYSITGKIPTEICQSETNYDVTLALNLCEMPSITCDNETAKLWDLDAIGISDQENLAENDPIYTKFVNSIVFNGYHGVMELPWKTERPEILNNYYLAKSRLIYTTKNQATWIDGRLRYSIIQD
jgi:hypothetical protein